MNFVSDRFKGAWSRIIRAVVGQQVIPSVDFAPPFRAKVIAQSSDLSTVSVQPDNPALPPLSGIVLRPPFPGTQVQIDTTAGAYVLVCWESADPSAPPYALALFDGGSATKIVLNADSMFLGSESGALRAARKTDPTASGTISMAVVNTTPGGVPTAVVTFLYTPLSGSPSTIGVLTFAAGLFIAPGANGSASIVGKITEGSTTVSING